MRYRSGMFFFFPNTFVTKFLPYVPYLDALCEGEVVEEVNVKNIIYSKILIDIN